MQIINNTAMMFSHDKNMLKARVNYDLSDGLKIIPSETYRQPLVSNRNFDKGTEFFVHELNERLIREGKTEVHEKTFSAINSLSFLEFVKNKLKFEEPEPQAIAHFILPELNLDDPLTFTIKDSFKETICLEKLPWNINELHNHRSYSILAQIESIEYYPVAKKISVTIAYRPAHHEGVYIQYV